MRKKTYGIGEACKLTGVSERQLRRWEAQGYLMDVQPRIVCSDRAYRRYSESNILQIRGIKSYLDEGYTLAVSVEKALKNKRKEVI